MVALVVLAVVVALVVGGAAGAWAGRAGRRGGPAAAAGAAELERMGQLVSQLQEGQARAHGELAARLGEAVRSTRELGATTRQLQEALGNSRVRGQWGERMADDVLRAAGLVEGINYERQPTVDGGTRPDIAVSLPDDRVLHIDVKFPADHYLASLDAPDERAQAEHEQAFLRAVRGHLKAVASRGYADPVCTPGFAVVFIPNEAIYAFLMAADPGLIDRALEHGLLVCSPFTLFGVLAVVRQASEAFRLGQASEEILGSLARFRTQWEKFSEHLDRVGRQFETAHRGIEELVGPRRRQLERQLDHIDRIGLAHDHTRPPVRFEVFDGSDPDLHGPETQIREVGAGR